MWNRITTIDELPEHIEVRVDYYRKSDYAELKLSLKGDETDLPPAEGKIIKIPKSEFLAYWLFEDRNPDDPLSEDFDTLAKSVADALPDLKRHFERSGNDLRAKAWPEGAERAGDIATRLGVAIGLCVANKITGLTQADWDKIPKTSKDGVEESRLDYHLAAGSSGFIAVENKGSISEDNSKKSASVSRHKRSIIKKKREFRERNSDGFLIGTIAVTDSNDTSKLKCWLLDPPIPDPQKLSPDVFRVINRMRFQQSLMKVVFPRWDTLHDAIEDRSQEIVLDNELQILEGKALKHPSGHKLKLRWKEGRKVQATLNGRLWAGVLGPCGLNHLLYVGLERTWADAVVDQNLTTLMEIHSPSSTDKVTLKWQPTKSERSMLIRTEAKFQKDDKGNDVALLPATLQQTSGGFAFALIKKEKRQIVIIRK